TSRFNGCLYCASVHARHAATYSKREDDVDRLLETGVATDLGERWNAIVAASVALTATPSAFGPEHVERLRRAGLDDLAISDVIHAAAFFNWANRLMLSLGEPAAPATPESRSILRGHRLRRDGREPAHTGQQHGRARDRGRQT